jgi:hypothetical protein
MTPDELTNSTISWLRTARGPRSVALEQLAGRLHLA